MNHFTKISTVAVLATGLSVSAMAEVTQPVSTPQAEAVVFNNDLNNTDLSYAFGDSQDLQVQAMTNQQMAETQGAWVANAVGGIAGGLGGHFGYMAQSAFTGEYNFRSHMVSVGIGAVGGAVNPVAGVGSAAASFGIGVAGGGANAWATNTGKTHRF